MPIEIWRVAVWVISTFTIFQMTQTKPDIRIGWHDSRNLSAAAPMRQETDQSVNFVNLGSPVPSLIRHVPPCAARTATLHHSHRRGVWCRWCLAKDPAHMPHEGSKAEIIIWEGDVVTIYFEQPWVFINPKLPRQDSRL